ncbi:NAD(P)/FAD-dependent oxidoreductase [uncultured Sphingomonas sp.]|uniref:flavin-containing monooxygenase n=1 Tax=uncultured Sphingomonas sp. TaxID=158754 RepID=UPI002637258E|nr:NAD(P)/FAD-dependent oxidoreductase [uncultured Sphingomonas sp.]
MNPDILDVIIVGAGVSGIGCACYLRRLMPLKRFAILEARGDLGGTWDLFRYPGIRSDSDLFTFGYEFRPWPSDQAIADGPAIQSYLRDTAAEYGVDRAIRYHHRLIRADWDSDAALWCVEVRRTDLNETVTLQCRWLFGATGYYEYAKGYVPDFAGREDFAGRIVHPQHWPDDLDVAGKRVAVIGSGATAVTLVPALARTAAHVVQVQRTPTYILPVPGRDRMHAVLRRILPATTAYAITRRVNIARQRWIYTLFQRYPRAARRFIRWANRRSLPTGFPINPHFVPPYQPWDQRLCVAPDGDYFAALHGRRASIVTGAIARFSTDGLVMTSGEHIAADILVTATGLKLQLFGGATIAIDGKTIDPADHLVYKGMMLDGVPNFSFTIGYTNASWTLKVGLICRHFCRLLELMDAREARIVVAERPAGPIRTRPLLDFAAGYVTRALDMLPRQGDTDPWQMTFDYAEDTHRMTHGPVDDPALRFWPASR